MVIGSAHLVVSEVDVLHGQQGEFVGAVRIAAVFHVAGDGEELDRRHDVRRGVDDDLVGRFERDRVALAQVERVEGAVGRILRHTHTHTQRLCV